MLHYFCPLGQDRNIIMDKTSARKRPLMRWRAAVVALFAIAATTIIGVAPANAATLTDTTWDVSNNQVGSTAVTYTFQFTTATTGTIGSVTATVPTGTAGTPAAGTAYGIGAGSVALSGTTLTYTVTTPVSVAAGIPIYIEFTGLTNTTTAGTYTSTVTTLDNVAAPIDTATSPSVSFGATSTEITVQIPKSLTFTNDTPSFTLQMDPSLSALADVSHAVTVTVKTNAGQGYSLAAKNTGLKTTGSPVHTIGAVTTGVSTGVASASFPANKFGISATLTSGGNSDVLLQGAGLSTSGNYVGYTTTGAGETLVAATKPTGNTADTLVLTNRVKIDYTTPAGTYTDTITYTATPTY